MTEPAQIVAGATQTAARAQSDYDRIAGAIDFIVAHFREQPTLEDMAVAAGLSPYHFQRLFSAWAGVSPKKFVQYLSLEHAKSVLKASGGTLLEATYETGLSSPGRLHDLFVNIERMTPGEYRNGGEQLTINYAYRDSPFGELVVASTPRGICHLGFESQPTGTPASLLQAFPRATFQRRPDEFQEAAMAVFREDWATLDRVRLHLKGSAFQLKTWECLLRIPRGRLATYGSIAKAIGQPGAGRAVGTAIGRNPVAYLIPCHRVIRASGQLGGYRWQPSRKAAIVGWETAADERNANRRHKETG